MNEKRNKSVIICGRYWTPIKKDARGTYYLLDDFLGESEFGENNNYAKSVIRKKLNNCSLAKELSKTLGSRLVPISSNLLSFDGLNDYGIIKGDTLAIPTFDLYRECRKYIFTEDDLIDDWWLATPVSTPSGEGASYVQLVYSGGGIAIDEDCMSTSGVRPFCIIKPKKNFLGIKW